MTDQEFQAAFEEHKDAVYRFAWRMMNSPAAAEDVAQDVFLSLLRQRGRFDPSRGRLRSFLLGITRNLVLKRWRDENQWDELGDEHLPVVAVSTQRNDIALIVGEAVRALPLLQREVLILSEYEHLSLEEIARAVDGKGRGDGKGDGPGGIDGSDGGCCQGPYRIFGGITAPTILYRVEPEYSEEARRARYQGTVVLETIIRKDGRVDVVQLVRSVGFGLDQNAIQALKEWRFRPATKDGVPVDVTMNIEVSFHLR